MVFTSENRDFKIELKLYARIRLLKSVCIKQLTSYVMNLALPKWNKLLVKQMMSAIPQTLDCLSSNRC